MDHCYTCKKEFRAEDIVVHCEGFCENQHYFHARCAGLTYDEGCACLHSNIFWMCDSCRKSIENGRFRKPASALETCELATKDEVELLKTQVETISKTVSQFISNSSATFDTSVGSCSNQHVENLSSSFPPPLTSTNINTVDLVTNQFADSMDNTNLQLYISNIANDVTDNEISIMVCEALGTTSVSEVKCLVSPWKNITTLDYVSFKVVVDAQYRDRALKASNWPTGVRCREFRDRYNSVWRPSRSIQR